MQNETAERIRVTAKALMVERGYSAFSYADIAAVLRITKASIHHHYPSKADLGVAVLRAHRAGLVGAMEQMDATIADPMERLRTYLAYWEGCLRGGQVTFCVAALLAAELPVLPEVVQAEVRLHFLALREWLERTLQAAQAGGRMRLRSDVATEADVLMAAIHGGMLSARAMGGCEVFERTTGAALRQIAA